MESLADLNDLLKRKASKHVVPDTNLKNGLTSYNIIHTDANMQTLDVYHQEMSCDSSVILIPYLPCKSHYVYFA
jgi:hypothetical protein